MHEGVINAVKSISNPHEKISLPNRAFAKNLVVDYNGNLAVVTSTGNLIILSTINGAVIFERKHNEIYTKVCIDTLNNNRIAVGGCSKKIIIYDLRSKNDEVTILAKEPIESLAMNCDGTLVAAGQAAGYDVNLEIWDMRYLDKNNKPGFMYNSIHSEDITALAFSPLNPMILATGSTDGLINVLNIDTYSLEEEEASIICTLKYDSINKLDWFGKNSNLLFASTHNEEFALYNAETETQLRRNTQIVDEEEVCFKDIINCYSVPEQNSIYTLALDGKNNIDIYNVTLDTTIELLKIKTPSFSNVKCAQIYNKGHNLISATTEDPYLLIWNLL